MNEIAARRTFAIISHPDAGKTTLTEKLLLFGGAIQLAGEVKARGDRRRARSDWMKVEQERGISVASSVMTLTYAGCTMNLLDTPGHQDFSEDTYRVLTAVDSAIMVLDAAKGIETQTRKLFEVCRLRDMPIITFVNKFDREALDPFELMDAVASDLALDVTPLTWPIGMGREFRGCYDLVNKRLLLLDRADKAVAGEAVELSGLDDPKIADFIPDHMVAKLREDVEMIEACCPPFDRESYLAGHLTPVFFGAALVNFGVRELLDGLVAHAPAPLHRKTQSRDVQATETKVSGFVFKIQANMDPKHRDRIAFIRLCSGHFKRGMKLKHVRTGKQITIHTPVMFLAQDRETAEEAWPGDIIGVPNYGGFRIGDSFSEGEELKFTGIPSFAPELLQRVRPDDPMKAKHLGRALEQLAEEGAARVFKPMIGSDWIVGVVGSLQFDVLADRIRTEYEVPVKFEATTLLTAEWVEAPDERTLKAFVDANRSAIAHDHMGDVVYLARNSWHLSKGRDDFPTLKFLKTKEQMS